MEIKLLRYFLQICEDKSFSKAAKNLYITRQGLSKAIKSLEKYLQVPLFYRKVDGVALTEYGENLKDQSIHFLEQFDSFLNGISKMNELKHEKLSVGFSLGTLNALSTDLISDFQKAYPQIELVIQEAPPYYCEKSLLDRDLDIAFTIGPIDQLSFNSKVVKIQYPCIIVNGKNPLSKKSAIDFNDLKDQEIIISDENSKTYHNFINKCRQYGFEPNIIIKTAEIYLVHKLSRLNKGIGVSVDFVATDINYPDVYSIPFADKTFLWDINLIYRKNSQLSNAGKLFLDYIMKY